jgi:hypothetical protein
VALVVWWHLRRDDQHRWGAPQKLLAGDSGETKTDLALLPEFHRYYAALAGISVEGFWCHIAFAHERKPKFPLLSEFEKGHSLCPKPCRHTSLDTATR